MKNLFSGFIPVLMCLVFMAFYAIRLGSVALWIIIVANLAFLLVDFVQCVKKERRESND